MKLKFRLAGAEKGAEPRLTPDSAAGAGAGRLVQISAGPLKGIVGAAERAAFCLPVSGGPLNITGRKMGANQPPMRESIRSLAASPTTS